MKAEMFELLWQATQGRANRLGKDSDVGKNDNNDAEEWCRDILLRCGYDESEYFECWDCPADVQDYCMKMRAFEKRVDEMVKERT